MVRTAFVVCALSLVSGCAAPPQRGGESATAAMSVSGIAVMPVVAAADDDIEVTPQMQQALLTGSKVMDGLLKEALAGRGKMRFIDAQTVGVGSFFFRKITAARPAAPVQSGARCQSEPLQRARWRRLRCQATGCCNLRLPALRGQ